MSEFRDRLFLVRALDAKGQRSASLAELAEADRLAARISLGPEWLRLLARIHARNGRVQEAKALLAKMSTTASDATAGSSANRDAVRDQGYLGVVRGEIALAEGRAADAVTLFEAALVLDLRDPDVIDSLAAAYVAAGRVDEAVKRYEDLIAARPFGKESQEAWLRAHVTGGRALRAAGTPGRGAAQLRALARDVEGRRR